MKHFILAAFLTGTALVGYSALHPTAAIACEDEADASEKPYSKINAEQLESMIAKNQALVIIDSRGAKYLGDGTIIKGAKQLGADQTNAETLAKFISSKTTPVVFYCSDVHCPASEAAAHKAYELGYTNIFKYPGGIADWKEKGLPTEKLGS